MDSIIIDTKTLEEIAANLAIMPPESHSNFGKIRNQFLYDDANGYLGANVFPLLFPYIAQPASSLKEVSDRIIHLKAYEALNLKPAELAPIGTDGNHGFIEQGLNALNEIGVYKMRRLLNGFIQFFTCIIAFWGLLMFFFLNLPALKKLEHIRQTEGDFLKDFGAAAFWKRIEDYRFDEDKKTMLLEEYIRGIKEKLNSDKAYLSYSIWAVPSIGFIGTILGISNALLQAHTAVSASTQAGQVASIQLITSTLAIAFDTTLVSLLLSLPMMLIFYLITRYEDKLLEGIVVNFQRKLQPPPIKLGALPSILEGVLSILQKLDPELRTTESEAFRISLEAKQRGIL